MNAPQFDEIGNWSEIKLDIVREYTQAYSVVLARQNIIRKYVYIDAFAGTGIHVSKQTGEYVLGSPLNALNVQPPFSEYHFIDSDGNKAEYLRQQVGDNPKVNIHEGDCNLILLEKVFPRARYEDFNRALCFLDPYSINLKWEVVKAAGASKSIEIFLNFMIMDMNRNVLRKNIDSVTPEQIARMDAFWGDHSWRDIVYKKSRSLFPDYELEEKRSNEVVIEAYCDRLKKIAGFQFVPNPVPMKNSNGSTVYYLLFATSNETGCRIGRHILDKYRVKGSE
jgi:three-Cys-motif partner protein